MTDKRASLGPLNLVDGRWVMGDARRVGGEWVEFRADGLYRHARESEGELVPWSRVMDHMHFTLGGKYPSRGFSLTLRGMLGGLPGPWKGRFGGYLHMTTRHSYGPLVIRFDREPRWYHGAELVLLTELLSQMLAAGEAHRLGDPDWLARVVARLAPQTPWTAGSLRRAVTQAREGEPPVAGDVAS